MNQIKILGTGIYLPKKKIENTYFNEKFSLDSSWIEKRTGAKQRFWVEEENASDMAIEATKDLLAKTEFDVQKIDTIIVASTTNEKMMPGIAFEVQKALDIKECFCMDISAGCSGYINAIDMIRSYIALGEIECGLVIGVETLSKYLDKDDISTSILLGDGAGATLIGKSKEEKIYAKNIQSIGQEGDILTCEAGKKLYMEGKKIYKFATSEVSQNIQELIIKARVRKEEIRYVIPHQSNIRIIENIAKRVGIDKDKVYININEVGNTFNASIPIALHQMLQDKLLKVGDKVILVGYGGGLNLGSILLEI